MMENLIRKEDVDKDKLKTEKKAISEQIHKFENDFEQKTLYISAGALGLSLTVIEKSASTECICILKTGWILLVISICIDLFSYLFARQRAWKIRELLSKSPIDFAMIQRQGTRTNNILIIISWAVFGLLIAGISLIVIFVTLNH